MSSLEPGDKQFQSRLFNLSWSKRRKLVTGVTVLIVGLLVGGGWLWWQYRQDQNQPVPSAVLRGVPFSVFYWKDTPQWQVDRTSAKYDKSAGILTFVLVDGSTHITMAEQGSPEAFSDVPQAYQKLLNSLNNYATYDTYYGKLYLTRPKEFNGQQSGVMSAHGTLMFAHPTDGSLTNDQWTKLFNALSIERS